MAGGRLLRDPLSSRERPALRDRMLPGTPGPAGQCRHLGEAGERARPGGRLGPVAGANAHRRARFRYLAARRLSRRTDLSPDADAAPLDPLLPRSLLAGFDPAEARAPIGHDRRAWGFIESERRESPCRSESLP